MIEELEAGMESYEKVILEQFGVHLSEVKGSGAAGGLGGCLRTFFNAEIKKGSELILELTGFDSLIKGADLVITACPLCMYNLDANATANHLPVKYFTELLAEALGVKEETR